MKNNLPPFDRLVKSDTTDIANPQIPKSVDIKIPDKEVHIMQHDEKPPDGGGTCSCHSVCTCVPVNTCSCNMVCTCDTVCATDLCACHPFSGCSIYDCSCVPVCTCDSDCTTCTTCSTCTTGGHYWYPC